MSRGTMGAYIKERRNQLKMRQRDLADAIDAYDRTYVNMVESGRIALPQHEMRQKIAAALGVREVDLLVAAGEVDAGDLVVSARLADLEPRLNALSAEHYEILVALLDQFLHVQQRGGVGGRMAGWGDVLAAEGLEIEGIGGVGQGEPFDGVDEGAALIAELDALDPVGS